MTNATVMETPETPGLLAKIGEFWPYIVSFAGVVFTGTTWGYIKFMHRKGRSVTGWLKAALNAPVAIADLKANMVLRAEFDGLKTTVHDMRAMQVAEVATRRAMFQHSDKAFFEADKMGRIVWVNTAYQELVDRELHEVTGNNWRTAIHDLDRPGALAEWRRCVEDCTDFRFKFRISTEDSEFWVIAEALCTKDDLGNVLSFAGALRKINDPRIQHA